MQKFFDRLNILIKKKFFIDQKTDICQDYKMGIGLSGLSREDIHENETEEYVNNYNSTTRWQTV